MEKSNDYQAGFTTPLHIVGRDQPLTGAAACSARLKKMGGVTGAQAMAIVAFQSHIEPVFSSLVNRLDAMQKTQEMMLTSIRTGQSLKES